MKCPYCSHEDTQVKDSRPSEDGVAIRRRRSCPKCDGRFTTFERVQLRDLIVIKRDGRKTPFVRDKLVRSMTTALSKRDVDIEQVEQIANNMIRRLERTGDPEVNVSTIGEMVMEALKELDRVAYIRFASVYKNFDEEKDFTDFLKQ